MTVATPWAAVLLLAVALAVPFAVAARIAGGERLARQVACGPASGAAAVLLARAIVGAFGRWLGG